MTGKPICVFGIIAISTLRQRSGFFFFLGRISGIVGVNFAHCLLMGADIFLLPSFTQCLLKNKILTCFLVRLTQRTTLSQPKQRRATQAEALGVTRATWNLRMQTVSDLLKCLL